MALLINLFVIHTPSQASTDDQLEKLENVTLDFDYLLGDFEQPSDNWSYGSGDQPTVSGSLNVLESEESYTGNFMAQLNADFTNSNHNKPEFVSMRKEVDHLDIEKVAFWVKTTELKALRIRTVDSTGQTFQQRIELQDTSDWQQVVVNEMGTKVMSHWGGANDGNWHKKARAVSILIDRNDIKNGALTASALVDQVTALLTPPPADFDYLISDFEQQDDKWNFGSGDTPTVTGSYNVIESAESYTGGYTSQLKADFSKSPTGAAFVSMGKQVEDLDIEQFAFWVKTSDLKALRIRTIDGTGQTFQQRIELQDTSDWQQVKVSQMGSKSFLYWNGANDGVWHNPAESITIMIDRNDIKNGAATATVLVDQVTAQIGDWWPELKIKQTVLGNIFLDNEPNSFIIKTSRPTVNWTAYDIYGVQVASGSESTIAGEVRITVPFSKLGYFTLTVSVEQPGSKPIVRKTAYAVISSALPPGDGESPFGVSTHLHRTSSGWSKELSKLIRYMGASFVRDGMEWNSVEKQKGVYTFAPTPDDYMEKLAENNLKLLFVAAFNNPFYDNNGTPYTDEGRRGFAEYAKAYVGHYKDQLIGFNVYNEFNGGFGKRGNSPANSQPDYYFKLMKETYNVVKAAHPEVPVVGIVAGPFDLNWIEGVMKGVGEGEDKNAGLKYLDAMSIQTYMTPTTPDEIFAKIEPLKTLIKKYNDGQLVPIWVSEFGSVTSTAGVDEKTQANYLPRGFVSGLELGVERMSWYDFMNDGLNADYGEDNFGLIRHKNDPVGAYTPKPAYASYAAMSRELAGASFERIEQFDEPIKSNVFTKDGKAFRVVWAQNETQAVIETDHELEITDFMGNTEIYTPYNGKIYMTITGEPFYIKGNINRIVKDDTFAIAGEQTTVGDPHKFTITVKNDNLPKLALTANMEDSNYPMIANQGQTEALSLTVSETRDGFRSMMISLLDEAGKKVGQLRHEVLTGMSHQVTVRPAREQINGQYSQSLNVYVENFRKTAGLTVNGITWKIGSQSGQVAGDTMVLPGEKKQFNIPLSSIALGEAQSVSIRIEFADQNTYEYEGNLSFNPITKGTIMINGEIEPEIEAMPPTIDLSKGKAVLLSGHSGTIDVKGNVWLNYDKDYFYLTAKIEDEVHTIPEKGAGIWNNDSIQFALSSGIPGESKSWYEYGISDTTDGTQVYRYSSVDGSNPVGSVANVKAMVTRDEEQKLTIYKLALPWSEISPIQSGRGEAMSFSLLVNDNNGDRRRGWIEWGSGIGNEKRPSLYRSMQWIFSQESPVAEDLLFTTKKGELLEGELKANHAQGASLIYKIVSNGTKGTAQITDEAKGTFVYTPNASAVGKDTFTFQVHDGLEYSNTATVTVNIEDKIVNPPTQGGFFPSSNVSTTGQLFLPGAEAGEVSLGKRTKLVISAGATDKSTRITIEELQNNGTLVASSQQLISPIVELRSEPAVDLNKPALLSLHFDPKMVGEKQLPSVWQYDEKQKKWIEVGGVVEGDVINAEITAFGKFAVFAVNHKIVKPNPNEIILNDINGHWGQKWIEKAVELGIVQGYTDHTFQPDRSVSRQELVVMLAHALQPEMSEDVSAFTDHESIGSWAMNGVATAVQAGWIKGYEDGSFRPQAGISRLEMAVIIVRAANLFLNENGVPNEFSDDNEIPVWAKSYVAVAADDGLIKGRGGNRFVPNGIVTRAEAATIMIRLLELKQQ